MGQQLFFVYFRSFQTNNTTFTTNQCEKCPSSIWSWDLNPQPFIHESSPITTRPGLPPYFVKLGSYYLLPIGLLLRIYLRLRQIHLSILATQTLPSTYMILRFYLVHTCYITHTCIMVDTQLLDTQSILTTEPLLISF